MSLLATPRALLPRAMALSLPLPVLLLLQVLAFVVALIRILLLVDLAGGDQGSPPIDGSGSLLPAFIPAPGKHTVKDLPRITKLCKKTPGTVKAFAQGFGFRD